MRNLNENAIISAGIGIFTVLFISQFISQLFKILGKLIQSLSFGG